MNGPERDRKSGEIRYDSLALMIWSLVGDHA